jgi:hypothetical protein
LAKEEKRFMAGREPGKASEKALDGLLQHTLQQDAPQTDRCPEPEILAAYFERSLDDGETAAYGSHLAECARCREQYAAMALAQAPAAAPEREKPRWAWLWDWRWLAPVTAVLALAFVWYARRPEGMAEKAAAPKYLAMARSDESSSPASSYNERAPQPAPEPPAEPTTSANAEHALNDLKKAERQAKESPSATAGELSEERAKELAERKEASDLASNLETDRARQKDTDALTRDTSVVPRAATPPAAAPPPASAGAPVFKQSQTAAPNATNAPAPSPAKTKQLQPQALATGKVVSALADRATKPIVRTPNPQVLWRLATPATSAGAAVERSTDGGTTWTAQLPGAAAQLTAGSAPSDKICWLVGRRGVILMTTNALDWKTIHPPAQTDFIEVQAKDASVATVTAADGSKFITSNGGESWTKEP